MLMLLNYKKWEKFEKLLEKYFWARKAETVTSWSKRLPGSVVFAGLQDFQFSTLVCCLCEASIAWQISETAET